MSRIHVEPLRVVHRTGRDVTGLRVEVDLGDRTAILRIEPGETHPGFQSVEALRAELSALCDAMTKAVEAGEIHPGRVGVTTIKPPRLSQASGTAIQATNPEPPTEQPTPDVQPPPVP